MAENLETKEKDLNDIKKELNASPMYNLSLSSKELFHSNFLAWLGNNKETRQFFVAVIKELAEEIELDCNGEWEVAREDKNFDLCIREAIKKIKKGEEVVVGYRYILVIENKVKSIPRKPQLDEYVKKIEDLKGNKDVPNYLLLTLANEFPDKKSISEEKKWEIKTYANLADAMNNALCCIKEEDKGIYHKSLIIDYISFISNLNDLVEKWQANEKYANNDDLGELNKISDLRAKIRFSSYCIKLQGMMIQELDDSIIVYDRDSIPEESRNDKLYIYVGWGYSSKGKSGLLDIAIPVAYDNENDNYNEKPKIKYGCCFPKCEYTIKIQVQGRSYCHVLEKTSGNRNLVKTGIGLPYTDDLKWFSEYPKNDSKVNYGNNDLFEDGLYPQNEKSVNKWPFKSYNSSFIYQSKTINKNAQVNAVLQNIVDEVKIVLEWLSK